MSSMQVCHSENAPPKIPDELVRFPKNEIEEGFFEYLEYLWRVYVPVV
jgi:hypothetical protein